MQIRRIFLQSSGAGSDRQAAAAAPRAMLALVLTGAAV
jgi:hypothetical protein